MRCRERLAADWGPKGIRVNAINPGIIATAIWEESRATVPGLIEDMAAQIPLKRWGEADDIAGVVVFLASDAARYVSGETLAVDGGMAYARASRSATPEFHAPGAVQVRNAPESDGPADPRRPAGGPATTPPSGATS